MHAALSSILMFVVVDEINDHPAYCRVRCLRAVVCTCVRIVCHYNALNSAKIYIHSGPFLLVFLPSSSFFSYYRFSLSRKPHKYNGYIFNTFGRTRGRLSVRVRVCAVNAKSDSRSFMQKRLTVTDIIAGWSSYV